MKWKDPRKHLLPIESPPSRGAWIEMLDNKSKDTAEKVAPLAGGVD